MTNISAVIFRNVLFLFSFLLLKPALAEPAVVIKWNLINKSLGITAKKTTLVIVLGEIRHQTGWEIFLEPNLNPAISIKTNPKPASEALGLLLGSLRYTLKTQSGRPSRLSIFRNSVSAATNPIAEAPAKPAKLEGQLAVVLKNETAAKNLAKEFGAELIAYIKDANAARFRFGSEQDLKRIRNLLAKADGVEFIDDIFCGILTLPNHYHDFWNPTFQCFQAGTKLFHRTLKGYYGCKVCF